MHLNTLIPFKWNGVQMLRPHSCASTSKQTWAFAQQAFGSWNPTSLLQMQCLTDRHADYNLRFGLAICIWAENVCMSIFASIFTDYFIKRRAYAVYLIWACNYQAVMFSIPVRKRFHWIFLKCSLSQRLILLKVLKDHWKVVLTINIEGNILQWQKAIFASFTLEHSSFSHHTHTFTK